MLENFTFAQFKFYLKPKEKVLLPPYAGSTLRGGFGYAFKKVSCTIREKNCFDCLLKDKCPYSYIFKTPVPESSERMRKYPYAPHPFIITPPLEHKGEFLPEDILAFQITLIGKAIEFLPYFIYTFEVLGEMGIGKDKGQYKLIKVNSLDNTDSEKEIYSVKDKILHSDFLITQAHRLSIPKLSEKQLILRFITPTRIKYGGKYIKNLQFHILLRSLLRRFSSLSYFHCNQVLDLDFKKLIKEAASVKNMQNSIYWYDWQRYSTSQGVKMKLGGFKGEISFSGDLKDLLQFIILGQYIHVGKGTAFGLGKYQVIPIKDKYIDDRYNKYFV